MEEKINIAELLKDCPKGMELDCAIYDNIVFDGVQDYVYPISVVTKDGEKCLNLTKYGCTSENKNAKCVIFPKGKTTWDGFVPPCKFKDGDIVTTKLGSVFILKNKSLSNTYCCYVALNYESQFIYKEQWFGYKDMCRFATDEEKQKLFQAIKDNGYKWNAENKTLEKLIDPEFNIEKGKWYVCKKDLHDNYANKAFCEGDTYLSTQDGSLIPLNSNVPYKVVCASEYFRDWTINDAKDGDVLAINWHEGDDSWEKIIIFKRHHNKGIEGFISSPCVEGYGNTFKNGKLAFDEEIPFFSKTWTANLHPATKEQCNLLFKKIKEAGYEWVVETKSLKKLPMFKVGDKIRLKNDKTRIETINYIYSDSYGLCSNHLLFFKEQDNYELITNKFDITTLKPFDKVLVRNGKNRHWIPALWGIKYKEGGYATTYGCSAYCIPYEGNEHLLNTTKDCDEYYKTWK